MIPRVVFTLVVACTLATAQTSNWISLGPDGGDVRSLAYDPRNPDRIFLGTSAGQLYLSNDGGSSWSRLAQLGDDDDYVLDNIAVDPQAPNTMYVAAWSIVRNHGDLFRSRDGGRTWQGLPGMQGKSIRALALAPSDPRILVAGALDGVFRSDDGGDTWRRISPATHGEIKNIESLAIDPRTPDIVYAGTWHLPWKTYDGGASWRPIHDGIIDDSDVFSIIVDRTNPIVVYASACSGIYKSDDAGHRFRKIQGIPYSARRTRVLQQDPTNPAIVYAGTTEGLFKTTDSGATWTRTTAANVIVNDVLVDPRRPERVLLATDRGGVLASNDGGRTFAASNRGFAHRQVAALLVDRSDPNTLYAGLVNDKDFGGLFVSRDAGAKWEQMSDGLGGRDVFTLQQDGNGDLVAGTNSGVFRYSLRQRRWSPLNLVLAEKTVAAGRSQPKSRGASVHHRWVKSQLTARVAQLAFAASRWFAATSTGLYRSLDQGASWTGGEVLGHRNFISVDTLDDTVLAASPNAVLLSRDGGTTWTATKLPAYATAVFSVAVAPRALWVITREGAFSSDDAGATWQHVIVGPPAQNLVHLAYDAAGRRMFGVAAGSGDVWECRDGRTWTLAAEVGRAARRATAAGARLLVVTRFNGIIAQPLEHVSSAGAPGTTQ